MGLFMISLPSLWKQGNFLDIPFFRFFHFFFLFTFPSLPPFLHPPYPSSHVSLSFSFPLTLMLQPSTVVSLYTVHCALMIYSVFWVDPRLYSLSPTYDQKPGLAFQIFTKRTDFTLFLAFAFFPSLPA